MVDTKISQELSASPLNGTELTEVVQSGNNRKATTQDIVNLTISGLAPSATTDTTNASNITSGILSSARLSAIPNSVLANSTLSLAISGNTVLSGTQANNNGFEFIGSLSGIATITWPTFNGFAAIKNGTTGGFAIVCGSGGASVTVQNGEMVAVWSDGTDFNVPALLVGGNQTKTSGVIGRVDHIAESNTLEPWAQHSGISWPVDTNDVAGVAYTYAAFSKSFTATDPFSSHASIANVLVSHASTDGFGAPVIALLTNTDILASGDLGWGYNPCVSIGAGKTGCTAFGVELDLTNNNATLPAAAHGFVSQVFNGPCHNAFLVTGSAGGTWQAGLALVAGSIHASDGTGILFGTNSTMNTGIDFGSGSTFSTAAIHLYDGQNIRADEKLSSGWTIDGANTGITLANSGTLSLVAGSGLLILNNSQNGDTGVFAVGGGGIVLIASTAGSWVASGSPASGKIGISFAESDYIITSNYGSSVTIRAITLKVNSSN